MSLVFFFVTPFVIVGVCYSLLRKGPFLVFFGCCWLCFHSFVFCLWFVFVCLFGILCCFCFFVLFSLLCLFSLSDVEYYYFLSFFVCSFYFIRLSYLMDCFIRLFYILCRFCSFACCPLQCLFPLSAV